MFSNLAKGVQLENSGVRIQNQASWLQSSSCNHPIILLFVSKGMDKEMRVIT